MSTKPTNQDFASTKYGTAEKQWADMLAQQPLWRPVGGPLIVVSPHPDAETLGAGGLIASHGHRGLPVTVVSVTHNEAAHCGCGNLAAVRQLELAAAMRELGGERVKIMRALLPDAHLGRHEDRLYHLLLPLVTTDATLVAPFENDGNSDHDAVGRVCRRVAAARDVTLARYPIWAWHQSSPRALAGARWGRFRLPALVIRTKARAMHFYASQLRPLHRDPLVPVLGMEYFQRSYEAFLL